MHKAGLTKQITFRCYAELNDFLPLEKRQKQFRHALKTPLTLGEAIESLRIPLCEVDLALVNGQPASYEKRLFENDLISVYPTFESLDISRLKGLCYPALRISRFILDAHLGKLAKYLRMLGFDTLYRNDYEDEEIIRIAAQEKRIVLTRDRALLHAPRITHGYYVRSVNKHEQLREVVRKFDLYSQFKSFSRCMTCNSKLVSKDLKEVRHLLQETTIRNFKEFFYCPGCRKVYWKGSHFIRMESYIRELT